VAVRNVKELLSVQSRHPWRRFFLKRNAAVELAAVRRNFLFYFTEQRPILCRQYLLCFFILVFFCDSHFSYTHLILSLIPYTAPHRTPDGVFRMPFVSRLWNMRQAVQKGYEALYTLQVSADKLGRG
jgi:hypothetical protein